MSEENKTKGYAIQEKDLVGFFTFQKKKKSN